MTSSFECMMSSLLQFRKIMAAAVVFLAMVTVAVGEYSGRNTCILNYYVHVKRESMGVATVVH